jgi:protein involved in polysaccharide export with SLBB domain
VIKIPLDALRSGDPRYNIIIRPGDVIFVQAAETGYFYVMGHVQKPGVYTLTGQQITLRQAVAAAGNLDALAIPRRAELIRRLGSNQEVIVLVNLQKIFDGDQPDIFLKKNDTLNIGTDALATFLAVTRNAYRASYGFGFVYDRNFYIQPQKFTQ